MTNKPLRNLAEQIEGALTLDPALADQAVKALADILPAGWDGPAPAPALCDDTDAVLAVATRLLPGWHFSMDGWATRPNGHWTCSIRRSDVRDNDPFLGIGKGPTLPHALLAALLKVIAYRPDPT